jgi:bifunctional enzyme CysN/CysC
MATGASTADLTIILIDAQKGVVTQTKRHSFIAALLGVPRLLIAINKMDLVGYDQKVFESISHEYTEFASRLGIKQLTCIPVSALHGDSIVRRSESMPWYRGQTVMEYLESVYIAGDRNYVDLRFPVQCVIRADQGYRGYAGQIRSGQIRVGEEVVVLPSLKRSTVRRIDYMDVDSAKRTVPFASAPQSVVIALEDELDISRGDMLVRARNLPRVTRECEAMMVWLSDTPMDCSRSYIVMHTSKQTKGFVTAVNYRIDVNSLSREPGRALALNEIGRVSLTTKEPLCIDPYDRNRATGNCILIDAESFQTVAGAMIIDRQPLDASHRVIDAATSAPQSSGIHREAGHVSRQQREAVFGARAVTIWCTGLSGSGKSTVAQALEARLFSLGRPVYRLDGDNLRAGLNQDLGFCMEDRRENIRRTAEVARLFNDAGVTVLCSLISPMQIDRSRARQIVGEESFIEVHLSTPLSVCEERDPHGLYRKARAGEIAEFTGISSPYEAPENPQLELNTARLTVEECVDLLLAEIERKSRS